MEGFAAGASGGCCAENPLAMPRKRGGDALGAIAPSGKAGARAKQAEGASADAVIPANFVRQRRKQGGPAAKRVCFSDGMATAAEEEDPAAISDSDSDDDNNPGGKAAASKRMTYSNPAEPTRVATAHPGALAARSVDVPNFLDNGVLDTGAMEALRNLLGHRAPFDNVGTAVADLFRVIPPENTLGRAVGSQYFMPAPLARWIDAMAASIVKSPPSENVVDMRRYAHCEFVTRAYTARYLRAPRPGSDERPCGRAETCQGMQNRGIGFVLREFLTPSQEAEIARDGVYPPSNALCVFCTRYDIMCAHAAQMVLPGMKGAACINQRIANLINVEGEYVGSDCVAMDAPVFDGTFYPVVMNIWRKYRAFPHAEVPYVTEDGYTMGAHPDITRRDFYRGAPQ